MRFLMLALLAFFAGAAPAQELLHKSILEGPQNALVTADHKAASPKFIASKKYLFVYFSAHWCPPCRKFTPQLVAFYNQQVKAGDFDVLFVSSDKDLDAMYEYMEVMKMPWLAIKWGNPAIAELKKRFAVHGIPCLVLLDQKDNVLASSYDENGNHQGPQVALEKYHELTGK